MRELERKQHRLKELEEETRECYESVLKQYPLSDKEQQELERDWNIGVKVIATYENATPDEYRDIITYTYDSEPLSNYIDSEMETSWRASFDLANALGLALITIDEAGNISGEMIEY